MSRTIRRKGKDVDPGRVKNYTHTNKWDFRRINKRVSACCISHMPLKIFQLPRKEFKRGWWKFHGDHYYPIHTKMYRKDWGEMRTQNRNNLVRALRDEDVECFFWEDVVTKDWD